MLTALSRPGVFLLENWMIGYRNLFWRGDALYRDGSKAVLARVIPDEHYPAMWRGAEADRGQV
jgi:hypothetical protein